MERMEAMQERLSRLHGNGRINGPTKLLMREIIDAIAAQQKQLGELQKLIAPHEGPPPGATDGQPGRRSDA